MRILTALFLLFLLPPEGSCLVIKLCQARMSFKNSRDFPDIVQLGLFRVIKDRNQIAQSLSAIFWGQIAIGNPLMSSLDFPPLHTVHESFPSHGVPSGISSGMIKQLSTIASFRS